MQTPSASPFEGAVSSMENQLNPASKVPLAISGNRGGASDVGFTLRPKCPVADCNKTFKRPPDLTRHLDTIHFPKDRYWCPVSTCNRHIFYLGEDEPRFFARKDKRNDHFKKAHKNEDVDLGAFDRELAEMANVQLDEHAAAHLSQEYDGAFVNDQGY